MEMDALRRQNNPNGESLDDFEQWLQVKMREYQEDLASGKITRALITIPTIVHVIHNGDAVGSNENISQAQVNSQFAVLNEDFRRMAGTPGFNNNPVGADVEIEFCPAVVDPNGNLLAEPGIHRANLGQSSWSTSAVDGTVKPQTSWDPNNYFNIWTVRFSSSSLLGYAQFPNSSGLSGLNNNNGGANTDGVVISYDNFGRVGNVSFPFDEGRTATHEVGHWLGLRHIWGDGGCSVDDFCNDTPTAGGANYGCPNNTSCGSADMVENYMDYTNDACMNIFTQCQKTRMTTVMANSPRRASLASSTKCNTPNAPPVTDFTADNTSGCPGHVVNFSDNSTNNPTSWSWTFSGGSPGSSTQQNPTVSYANTGTYNVSLTTTNQFGSDNDTKNGYIIITSGASGIFWTEDFESGPNGWQVSNPDQSTTWAITGVSGNTPGSNAAFIDNFNYNAPGQRDGLLSPTLDFSGQANVTLDFEHAHRRFSSSFSDSLVIYLSTDNGSTFPHRLYGVAENGSGNFATNGILQAQFVPSAADDWCFSGSVGASCISINLGQWDGMNNIRLMFENVNDYGNNTFIDNVELSGTCNSTPPAPISLFAANQTADCAPMTITFADQSLNNPTSWSWTFQGGAPATSSQQNPTVTYSTPGTYDVTLTATNGTGSNTNTLTGYITVYAAPPKPTISQNGNVLTSSAAVTYQWNANGFPIPGATSQSHTATATGAYTVTVTDANGCENVSDPVQITITTLEAAELAASVAVFPNPTTGRLHLEFAPALGARAVEVIEPTGRVVYTRDLSNAAAAGRATLNLGELPAGVYLIRLHGDRTEVLRKVVVYR